MRLAIASSNGVTIQRHFGRTKDYVVVTVDDGREVAREVRSVESPAQLVEVGGHGPGQFESRMRIMTASVQDCDVLVAGGMGHPMVDAIERAGLDVILTNERLVEDIISAYLAGTLEHQPDLAHEPCH
ncbi:MAG TPA: hypothetical protein ENH00_08495 [Actinobacteria bacterium]|nr:dinitrogenase iron-molybdenum cofactor [bacterium BMS3Bbin01]HDH26215.1 hypothetical protein [Actinomycetota bacterium]